ncbi:unnamed protein product [Cylicostephanus goldi]|uniref:Innexin n=1 Tax=Cylicostephanus goldi TaxID=71465 RepID=A0A3P7N0Q2_CYLGO|nr:unnamed protein product [Cylicostephanus goldi]
MPFFLLFEAACFRLPTFIWKYFASQSGMKVGEILRLATDEHNTVPEIRRENIHALCIHLQGALRFQKRLKMAIHDLLRDSDILYCQICVSHECGYTDKAAESASFYFYLPAFIADSYFPFRYLIPHASLHQFGFDVWHSLWRGNKTWETSGLFPRVTLCDFDVREMGNIQTHTVQCVLLLNVLTEKIFILLWAWYVFLATLTACNLFSWMFSIFSETSKEHFLINHLEILIGQHADVVFITELVGYLWKSHNEIEEQRQYAF